MAKRVKTAAETLDLPPTPAVEPSAEPGRQPVQLTEQGVYDGIPEADYHADPCPAPSLSRSVLKLLVDLSPAHAYVAHPKLGGLADLDDDAGEIADFGTAAHSAFLLDRPIIKRLDFPDWRTNAAKAARAEAHDEGLVPLLPKAYDRAMRLVEVLENFRNRTGAFTKGKPEQTVVWQDGAVWCRSRVDWLPDEPSAPCWDLKSTAGRATLQAWSRVAFEKGADIQDSFYGRGLEICRGEPPDPMLFCVVEQKPPFSIGVFQMAPSAREAAEDDIRIGLSLWENCLATREWPAYDLEPQWVFPPPWAVRQREERGLRSKDLEKKAFNRRETAFVGEHPNAVGYVESENFGG